MKYPWLAATIVLILLMATFTISVRKDVHPEYILGIALIAALFLGAWGLRPPK